jgi:surfactin family lipopeptide synthetase B/lichenysin synthetase B
MSLYSGEKPAALGQFKDYLHWVNNRVAGEQEQQQEAYWLDIFKGDVPVLALPYDYPRPVERNFSGGK